MAFFKRFYFYEMFNFFDKNWLWGEMNIQKGELCANGILSQGLRFVGGPFQRGFRGFWG
jgi:hypothetical protein